MPEPEPSRECVPARADLRIAGRRFAVTFDVPTAAVGDEAVLPLARTIADTVVSIASEEATAAGGQVSCRAGCGACCRQLVPVSPVEARALAALVEELPEPRRTAVRARFAEARRRVAEAGLLERVRDWTGGPAEKRLELAHTYFALGIACPFLEDESCSIHRDRPLACREYLVTSPAANCARPSAESIRMVPVPARISHVLHRLRVAEFGLRVPLVLAPEFAAEHPPASPEPGTEVFRRFLRSLSDQPPDGEAATSTSA
jgi:Fe-S-cluster containining protein